MREIEFNNKVLLGMSGGIDSFVVVFLLQDVGYEVIGIIFCFYEKENDIEYLEDVCVLCECLNIFYFIYDVCDIFWKIIIDYFINEYMVGYILVFCILCNNYLKWFFLKKIFDEMGIYYFVIGYYVCWCFINGCYYIIIGVDLDKD